MKEAIYWLPLIALVALAAALWILNASPLVFMLGMSIDPSLFAKIERVRHCVPSGITIDSVCDQVAEQHDVDPEQLMVEHFAWQLACSQDGESVEKV